MCSNISFTESDISIYIGKAWTAIERLSIKSKFDLSDKIRWEFIQVVAVLVLLYGFTNETQG